MDVIETAVKAALDVSIRTVREIADILPRELSTRIKGKLDEKQDKVAGKGLSTEDYTTAEKTKLSGIETGAEVNAINVIIVNGNAVPVANKTAALTLPTKVSDLTNDSNFQDEQQVEDKIDAKVSSAYKAGGSATMATLPALTAAKLGVVVNMSEDFTTTSDFLEGAGKTYPAGTNVVVAEASANVYKYDVLAGFVDLSGYVGDTRKIGNVPLSADIPVTLTGDTAITVTNTGTASAIGYSVTHKDSGVTAGSKGDTTNQTPGFGGTFKVLSATVDAKGHVTVLGDHTARIPDAEATVSAKGLMSVADKAKLDKHAPKGSATRGIYIDASDNTQPMTYELNADVPSGFAPASAVPLMDGTVTVGTSAKYAREDHKHPTDTSRASAADLTALVNYIKTMDVYRNTSGNLITFGDGSAFPVRNLSVTLMPMQSGSGDPSPDNIRPISGAQSVTVTRTGKNLFPSLPTDRNISSVENLDIRGTSDGGIKINGTVETTKVPVFNVYIGHSGSQSTTSTQRDWKKHLKNGIYRMRGGEESLRIQIAACKGPDTDVYFIFSSASDGTFEVTDDDPYNWIRLSIVAGTYTNRVYYPRIYYGSDADMTFDPYQEQTATVQLTDGSAPLTVYGGTLNVTTGELTVTWDFIASYDGETLPGVWISDRDVYTAGTTPTTGAQVAYELASPVQYQLTPAQLATLYGYNTISSDAGSTSVTYRADPELVLGGG